jgi:hypothetical protein
LFFMNNPHRYEASRGDCFFKFFWPLLISLLLHLLVLGKFDSGQRVAWSVLVAERGQLASPLQIIRIFPKQESRELGVRVSEERTNGIQTEKAAFLRSTAKKTEKSKAQASTDTVEKAGDFPAVSDMEAAEYRLALARTVSRLQAANAADLLSPGEVFLELMRPQGTDQLVLRTTLSSVSAGDSKQWHALMQAAVDETSIPAAWSGRGFRLPLKLLVVPSQYDDGSACSSCS